MFHRLFFVFIFFACVFLVFSCAAEKSAGETVVEEIAAPPPRAEEGQDLVLAAFRDPDTRERTLAFFAELSGSRETAEAVLVNAGEYGINAALAFSLCAEESAFNPQAVNRNRNGTIDRGLFQLNNASFPKLRAADFYKTGVSAKYGLAHLRWCLETAGTEVAALAMYNAGTTRVRSGGTPKSTLDYISRILGRQADIEKRFEAEYPSMIPPKREIAEEKPPEKTKFRLSLLTPLGGR